MEYMNFVNFFIHWKPELNPILKPELSCDVFEGFWPITTGMPNA